MVRLTVDLIARGTSGYTKKKREESVNHYLKRLTHLYLEDRNIDDVGEDLALCRNLSVLYLYDNKMSRIPHLHHNPNLTHLYLQNNNISKIENLGALQTLTKLYLGSNKITVLEGLEKLDLLQELHIENQRLPPGEKLLFDPRTINTLNRTLQVLNVSGNNLDSIAELEGMSQLAQFMASDNQLTDMKELTRCLVSWHRLWRLELLGNPFCHKSKYRDRVIVVAPRLEVFDGREVTETSKKFLQNWQANKEAQKRKRSSYNSRQNTMAERDLPPVSSQLRHGAIPGYMMPALPRKQFQEVLAKSANHTTNGASANRLGPELSPPKYLNTLGTYYNPHTHESLKLPKSDTGLEITNMPQEGAGDAAKKMLSAADV